MCFVAFGKFGQKNYRFCRIEPYSTQVTSRKQNMLLHRNGNCACRIGVTSYPKVERIFRPSFKASITTCKQRVRPTPERCCTVRKRRFTCQLRRTWGQACPIPSQAALGSVQSRWRVDNRHFKNKQGAALGLGSRIWTERFRIKQSTLHSTISQTYRARRNYRAPTCLECSKNNARDVETTNSDGMHLHRTKTKTSGYLLQEMLQARRRLEQVEENIVRTSGAWHLSRGRVADKATPLQAAWDDDSSSPWQRLLLGVQGITKSTKHQFRSGRFKGRS